MVLIFLLFRLPGEVLAAQEQKPAIGSDQKPAAKQQPNLVETTSGVEMEEQKDGLKVTRTHEDFSSLSLVGSELVSKEPVLGGHEENKDFVRDLYQVQWRSNDPIDLFIIRPAGMKKVPVVLYLYGFPSDTDRFRNSDWCRRVTANGVAAVGFVSALTGQRYHTRPMKEWFLSELPQSLAMSVHDVQMILNLLEKDVDLDLSKVGMFGQGSGGAIAILAASVDPRIEALDLLGPWGDWPDWLTQSRIVPANERPEYVKPEYLKKLETLEPVRYLPGLKDRKIRIQFIDDPPPMKSTKQIEDAAPSGTTIVHYPDTKELFSVSSGGRLFQWLAMQLKPQATPVSAQALPAASSEKEGRSN